LIALDDLRRFAVGRHFPTPTSLTAAIDALGFVQADPIRAPARAQDLTLRHRVDDYRAGDLERRYATLAIEEDVFINYGFVTRPVQALMHRRLRYAAPQCQGQLRAALDRAKQRLSHAQVDGADWYWPAGEQPARDAPQDVVRFLAPFDPLVWDRRRFELLWGWAYRFEAYTPARARKLGYYALPLLWRDRVIGWGNISMKDGGLVSDLGYASSRPPRNAAFKRGLETELDRLRVFLVTGVGATM
jgi:hypothetical protein